MLIENINLQEKNILEAFLTPILPQRFLLCFILVFVCCAEHLLPCQRSVFHRAIRENTFGSHSAVYKTVKALRNEGLLRGHIQGRNQLVADMRADA